MIQIAKANVAVVTIQLIIMAVKVVAAATSRLMISKIISRAMMAAAIKAVVVVAQSAGDQIILKI